jgi:hypothetical protein
LAFGQATLTLFGHTLSQTQAVVVLSATLLQLPRVSKGFQLQSPRVSKGFRLQSGVGTKNTIFFIFGPASGLKLYQIRETRTAPGYSANRDLLIYLTASMAAG